MSNVRVEEVRVRSSNACVNDTIPLHLSSQPDIDEMENLINHSVQSTVLPAPPRASSLFHTLAYPGCSSSKSLQRRPGEGIEGLGSVGAFLLHCLLGSHALLVRLR
ncbi:hypothetical protein V6N12_017797 [Hibiscus sabdariffa]|uniref:Uncharacterized protein n=1 Tax=Hibiscus sabdariffa TaxID=183260 RepID=A0ABR2BBP4_9ROSI